MARRRRADRGHHLPVRQIRLRARIASIRRLLFVGALAALGGCSYVTPPFDASTSESAQESYSFCQQGATCVLKPMAMLVLNKTNPAVNFDFRSWILYDPRPWPVGQRYVAFMNESNDPVCEGYYLSIAVNVTAPMAMTCFPREAKGRGDFRFYSLQKEGRFAGKSTGTGLLETASETILFAHGATPEENQKASFKELWEKYGGPILRPVSTEEASAKRIPALPRLAKARPRSAPATADSR